MRRKLEISILMVLLAVAVGVVASTAASGQTVLHLVTGSNGDLKTAVFDADGRGLGLGDRIAARVPLLDETQTEQLGTAYLHCVVHKRIVDPDKGLWNCNYVLELADGDLMLQGLDPRGPGEYEVSVIGGTGAYANARGDATFTDVGADADGYTDMVIRWGA
ncbi:MAG: Dirigent-like protein [Acidobacteriota bacterium]|jgi:hypothetical protein|nr:Dirigent-like protein [Acidobacteriota bacterium]